MNIKVNSDGVIRIRKMPLFSGRMQFCRATTEKLIKPPIGLGLSCGWFGEAGAQITFIRIGLRAARGYDSDKLGDAKYSEKPSLLRNIIPKWPPHFGMKGFASTGLEITMYTRNTEY
jgi:hypothetical protein